MIEEVTACTISELMQTVDATFVSTNSRWWFRGQRDSSWGLSPKVRRGYSKLQERYLSNLFYTRAQSRHIKCPADDDYGSWLALMQHFGLPTRLLDWSDSPLIAAYFAAKHQFDTKKETPVPITHAAVWMVDPIRLNVSQGYEPVFPPLNAASLRDMIRPAIKGDDISNFAVLAASPLEVEMRMFVQQGKFTVHVTDKALENLDGSEEWLRKIKIPVDAVPHMARELDLLGLRLADVFPDLENLAREITNMHPPYKP